MDNQQYLVQDFTPFGKSNLWSLNFDYYQDAGIKAWSSGDVPHYLTSNARVGKTYAELIFAGLKDIKKISKDLSRVYILEVGAGHGRLAYHTLRHLDKLIDQDGSTVPEYTYIISDISEECLDFFIHHPQFRPYIDEGKLEVAYFDALNTEVLDLRISKKSLKLGELETPIIVLANYFFDSIPSDLFCFSQGEVYSCAAALKCKVNPESSTTSEVIANLEVEYQLTPITAFDYDDDNVNAIMKGYTSLVKNTFVMLPTMGIECIKRIKSISRAGVILITMDKGHHEIHDLENVQAPKLSKHGSLSFMVNYHALSEYCMRVGGMVMLPEYTTFSVNVACMLFMEEVKNYKEIGLAYDRSIDTYGPDDFNQYKKFVFKHKELMQLSDIIGFVRQGAYDAYLLEGLLPRIKQLIGQVTYNERYRLRQTLLGINETLFEIGEPFDMKYEIGGLLFDLAYYEDALSFFTESIHLKGDTPSGIYNQALCHYQLRQDKRFIERHACLRAKYPDFAGITQLEGLDLDAQ